MGFNGLDGGGGKGQVFLFGVPVLVKQGHGFVGGIEYQALGQQRLGGKVGQFVGGECVKAPGAADSQGGVVVGDVGDRRQQVVGRGERGRGAGRDR